ncbi:hypothetical protein [Pacificibacter marinus]|uniref:hypothetical protein n=1 Tax=Pacificibacter marinus TaxID=658057 RepID=UPI001C06ACBB|nr:hypothetical protein [Pacificibacter marinus]MBU2868947.1 hypothetical protein [Pacificibacter marinus]
MTDILSERDRKAYLDLLELAEKVQAEKELAKRQFFLSLFGVTFGVLGILAIVFTYFGSSVVGEFTFENILRSPAGALGLVAAMAGYFLGSYLTMLSMKKIRRERKAFEEVMGLVHEVYEATKSDLSAVEKAEVKIRFSRLDN